MSAQKMVLIKKCKTEKTAKGYRLKISTHKLIDEMQKMLKSDKDTVITRACKLLYKELRLNTKNKHKGHNTLKSNSETEIIN